MARHRRIVIAAGLLGSAVFIMLAVRHLDISAVKRAWADAHVWPWLPIGIGSYLLGHVVRGLRCRLLVRREAAIPLITASNIVVVGYASNNVLPARLGELVRAGMLAERTGMPVTQSLAVTVMERVLDGLAILCLLVLGTLGGNTPGWVHRVVQVALGVFGVATLGVISAAYSSSTVLAIASRLGSKLGPRVHDRLVSLASNVVNAAACLRAPRDAAMLVFYSLLVWSLEAGLFAALLPIFGLGLNVVTAVVAMSLTNLGLLVPSSPGFIGPFHYFCSRALMARGVDESTAVAYATLVHLAFYVPVTIWGAAAMLWYGVEVGSTAAIARDARAAGKLTMVHGVPVIELAPVQGPPSEPPVSAFTVGLVEAIVGSASHPVAVTYAAGFVDGQIAALPAKLRVMFGAGMTFFRFATRVRFLRGYCDVPLAARRAWTQRWAEGRIALVRQLFKPVRATALLAYYDHSDVKRELLAGGVDVPATSLVARAMRAAPELG